MRPISRETIVDRRQPQMRWSAVFAGAVLSIGLWVLLQVIGMGVGMTAIDIDDAGNLRGIGIGTGVWSLLAPLIALFIGGLLAGRLAATHDSSVGAMHGLVQWALTSAAGVFLLFSLISMVVSGATRIGGAAVRATTAVVSGAASAGADASGGDVMSTLGINENDLLGPVNQRLREQGKPVITADQLGASLRSTIDRGLREGRIDRELLVQEIARNTALTREDVNDLAQQLGDRYDRTMGRAQDQLQQVGEQATTTALQAGDAVGKALLTLGLVFLLGLGCAAGGGALGARMAARHDLGSRGGPVGPATVTTTTLPATAAPVAPATTVVTPRDPDDVTIR